jgi:hypothetical protein
MRAPLAIALYPPLNTRAVQLGKADDAMREGGRRRNQDWSRGDSPACRLDATKGVTPTISGAPPRNEHYTECVNRPECILPLSDFGDAQCCGLLPPSERGDFVDIICNDGAQSSKPSKRLKSVELSMKCSSNSPWRQKAVPIAALSIYFPAFPNAGICLPIVWVNRCR